MASNGTPRGSGLFNVSLQVLKFVLTALAVYSMSLSQQLGIELPATLALVDATPAIQNSRDGSFKVAFYALHFLQDYEQLELKVYFKNEDNTDGPVLSSITLHRKEIPFYSEEIKLPDLSLRGRYRFGYDIAFDSKADKEGRKSTGKSYQIVYDPFIEPDVTVDVPISVRRGQRALLPANLSWLDLRPADQNIGVSVDSGGNKRWLRANGIGSGSYRIALAFTSHMTVNAKSQRGQEHCFNTGDSMAGQMGPLVCVDNGTFYKGQINNWDAIQPGDRIAFIGSARMDGSLRASHVVATRDQQAPEGNILLGLIVLTNEPPRSAYALDVRGEVTMYTSWRFSDSDTGLYYLNLNRYIIDPDGRNQSDEADIRVKQLHMAAEDRSFELQAPSNDRPEFRLVFRQSVEQIFRAGRTIEVPVVAQDEANPRVPLTLKITMDR